MERPRVLEPQISRYFTLHGRICQQNSLSAESAPTGIIFKIFPEIAAGTRKSARAHPISGEFPNTAAASESLSAANFNLPT